MDILALLEVRRRDLTPAESAVADAILRDPGTAVDYSLAQLAAVSGSGEATVSRFCRRIGLSGFRQLRMELAIALERDRTRSSAGGFAMSGEVGPSDSLEEIARKVGDADAHAASLTGRHLDPSMLGAAVEAIERSSRILVIGHGSSSIAADDAAVKLRMIGRAAVASADVHESLGMTSIFTGEDLVLAFSHSGRSREVIEVISEAGQRGARTILVSNSANSPAARAADVVVQTSAPATSFRAGGMASRIAQLAVVDVLFAALSVRHPSAIEAADRMRAAVRSHVAGD